MAVAIMAALGVRQTGSLKQDHLQMEHGQTNCN